MYSVADTSTMDIVTVSSSYQVVIPEGVRRQHRIRIGDQPAVIVKHGAVQLVPVRPFESSKGEFRDARVDFRDLRDHANRAWQRTGP
jgi:bifunctional DNA-binding transcriptional regulator/antitoxin component of YhaV-PrlF toxin-antitoxin module